MGVLEVLYTAVTNNMPGKIESVPFLSQLEDVDKYLLEYRSLKLTSPNPSSYNQHHQIHGQMRYSHSNGSGTFDNGGGDKSGIDGKQLPMGNVMFNGKSSNSMSVPINGAMGMNRKKVMNTSNQSYRYNNNAAMKYGAQYQPKQHQQPAFAANSMITNHLKQVYPQMSYNTNGSGSNLALDQLSSSFMVPNQNKSSQQQQQQQQQQGYPSSNSSPSPAPPLADAALSGNSSISSFSSNIGYVLPTTSGSSNSQFAAQAPFSNYLDSGLISSASIAPGISPTTNISAPTGTDMVGGYPSNALANEAAHTGAPAFNFEQGISTPALMSEAISVDRATPLARENTLASFDGSSGSMNNSGSNLLMNDYSVGWGSNHANSSSSAGGSFGIWNNDMSVWS